MRRCIRKFKNLLEDLIPLDEKLALKMEQVTIETNLIYTPEQRILQNELSLEFLDKQDVFDNMNLDENIAIIE